MEKPVEYTRRITEYIDLDLAAERWRCNRCRADLGDARDTYKKGCLIAARAPGEGPQPLVEGSAYSVEGSAYSFAPDRDWCRIVEFYCPRCAVLVEVEYLPPGHPLTRDIELDIEALRSRYAGTPG